LRTRLARARGIFQQKNIRFLKSGFLEFKQYEIFIATQNENDFLWRGCFAGGFLFLRAANVE